MLSSALTSHHQCTSSVAALVCQGTYTSLVTAPAQFTPSIGEQGNMEVMISCLSCSTGSTTLNCPLFGADHKAVIQCQYKLLHVSTALQMVAPQEKTLAALLVRVCLAAFYVWAF